jgi:integrase
MIGEAPTEQTRLLVKVLWATGARVSEIIGLSAADLDTGRRTLHIHRKKRRNAFAQDLPIPADLASELRLFIRTKRRRGRIFTGDRSSIYRTVRRLGQKVLGRRIGPHQFRHGKAYALVQKGVHPLLVSRALGHANLSSALAYYHPTEADLRRVMEETV